MDGGFAKDDRASARNEPVALDALVIGAGVAGLY